MGRDAMDRYVFKPLKRLAEVVHREDFGRDVAFHGGIDIQFLLPQETPEIVAAEARRVAGILGAQGGYVLSPSHNIQLDTPTENIRAMYRMEARRV